jgi:hypothetical protein
MILEEIEHKPDDINELLDDLAVMIAKVYGSKGIRTQGGGPSPCVS